MSLSSASELEVEVQYSKYREGKVGTVQVGTVATINDVSAVRF